MGVLRKLASTPRIVLLARSRGRSAAALLAFAVAASSFSSPLRAADEPLHERIDRLVEAAHSGASAPIASDADFLRRAHLVLTGIVPTAAQAREFFADKAAGKRAALIDRLIASREFTRWIALRFDVMLMERRGELYVKRAPWRQYLEESFATNKPWHQLVRELLSADGADEKTRGIARWSLEREGDPHLLTRDVARLFLGRDIACAQCHDHPRIDDYMQRDYYGLHAFVSRTHLFQPDPKKPALLAERADGEAAWTSVFTKISGSTKPRLPERDEIAEPTLAAAELWSVPPNEKDKNVRPVPKFSRRAQLAALLTEGDHPAFRRNIANRLWYIVFGRGLVEPLDLHHSANPPSNPALLDLLAETIAAGGFDMKKVIREMALTRTFQRAIDLPLPASQLVGPIEEELPCLEEAAKTLNEIAARSDEAFTQARQTLMKGQREGEPFEAESKKQSGAVAEAQKASDAAQAALKKAEEAVAARRDAQRALAEAATKSSEAAAKVPDAPELAAAAKTFETKAAQAGNEAAAAEKEVTAKKGELAAKMEALTAAQTAAAAARAKVEEVRTSIAKLQHALDREAARKQRDRISARHAVRLAAEARALVAWVPAAAADHVARETAQRAETALTGVRNGIDHLTAELMDGPSKIVALETAAGTALAQIATSREAVTQRSGSVASLAEAAAKSADAAAKLAKDAEVQTAAAAVKAKADAFAVEVAALEKAAAEAPSKSEAANKALLDSRSALEKAAADLLLAQQQIPQLAEEAKTAREIAARTRQPATQAGEILATTWSETFGSLALYPLMPEQLCWSVMQATGFLDQQRAEVAAEWDKKNPLTDADKANPAKQAERTVAIENALSEKIRPHEDQYVRAFGGAAGQPQTDFFATPEQALYFENGGVLRGWSTILSGRLAPLSHPREMAEELYLSTLTRAPTDAEVQELTDAVAARQPEKKREALADLTWALITSAEFRFLH